MKISCCGFFYASKETKELVASKSTLLSSRKLSTFFFWWNVEWTWSTRMCFSCNGAVCLRPRQGNLRESTWLNDTCPCRSTIDWLIFMTDWLTDWFFFCPHSRIRKRTLWRILKVSPWDGANLSGHSDSWARQRSFISRWDFFCKRRPIQKHLEKKKYFSLFLPIFPLSSASFSVLYEENGIRWIFVGTFASSIRSTETGPG